MKYYLILVVLLNTSSLLSNCHGKKDNKKDEKMTMPLLINQEGIKIRELFHLEWDKPGGLNRIFEATPITSIFDSRQKAGEPITSHYRFRITPSGKKIIILANNPLATSEKNGHIEFIIYDTEQNAYNKTLVTLNENQLIKITIIDFLLTEQKKIYLLEQLITKENKIVNSLRYCNADGTTIWEVKGNAAPSINAIGELPSGKYTRIIKETENALYIQYEAIEKTSVLKINTKKGSLEKWTDIDNTDLKLFIDDKLQLNYVSFIKEVNNRAYIQYNPENNKKEIQYATPDIYAALAFPLGEDMHNNIYYANGLSLSCITPMLQGKWILPINNIVTDTENLFISQYNEVEQDLLIYKCNTNGTITETNRIHLDMTGIRLGRLYGLMNSNIFFIETIQGNNKLLWRYDKSAKKLTELPEQTSLQEFRLQAAQTWQIDQAGNVYLPVAGSNAFHIIKIFIGQLN